MKTQDYLVEFKRKLDAIYQRQKNSILTVLLIVLDFPDCLSLIHKLSALLQEKIIRYWSPPPKKMRTTMSTVLRNFNVSEAWISYSFVLFTSIINGSFYAFVHLEMDSK